MFSIATLAFYTIVQDFDIAEGTYTATVQKMTLSHIQMLGVLGIFKAKGTATFNRIAGRPAEIAGGSFTSVLPIKCTLGSQAYGPFLLNMLLPILIPALIVIFLVPMKIIDATRRRRRPRRACGSWR